MPHAESEMFVVSLRRACRGRRHYVRAIWNVKEISDTAMSDLLVSFGRASGGKFFGFHRIRSVCQCHHEAEAEISETACYRTIFPSEHDYPPEVASDSRVDLGDDA